MMRRESRTPCDRRERMLPRRDGNIAHVRCVQAFGVKSIDHDVGMNGMVNDFREFSSHGLDK